MDSLFLDIAYIKLFGRVETGTGAYLPVRFDEHSGKNIFPDGLLKAPDGSRPIGGNISSRHLSAISTT